MWSTACCAVRQPTLKLQADLSGPAISDLLVIYMLPCPNLSLPAFQRRLVLQGAIYKRQSRELPAFDEELDLLKDQRVHQLSDLQSDVIREAQLQAEVPREVPAALVVREEFPDACVCRRLQLLVVGV